MYQQIGEVFLQTIGKIKRAPYSQSVHVSHPINIPYPMTTNSKTNLQDIEIRGYVFNDINKTRKEYISDMNALMGRSAGYNRINIDGNDGFINIKEIDIRNSNEELNTYIISGMFLPPSGYMQYYWDGANKTSHDFADYLFTNYFVMPYGTQRARLANLDNEYVNCAKVCNVVTPEGSLPLFRHPSWLGVSDGTNTGFTDKSDVSPGCLTASLVDVGDNVRWDSLVGIDMFDGNNVISVYAKISGSATETVRVTVYDNNTVVAASIFDITNTTYEPVYMPTATFTKYSTCTVEVQKVSGDGEIDVAGITINNSERKKVEFITPAPVMEHGECKLYDTMGKTDANLWKRIYNLDGYTLVGDFVFENATMQWFINPRGNWSATGKIVDRISGLIGFFKPLPFSGTEVMMTIDDIKPDCIELTFTLTGGSETAGANNAVVRVRCTITPLSFKFDVRPGNTITYVDAYDWVYEIDPLADVTVGTLDDAFGIPVVFTEDSSITIVRSEMLANMGDLDTIHSYDNTLLKNYTFFLSVLPRVIKEGIHEYEVIPFHGTNFYMDGEYIDTTEKVLLIDYLRSLLNSGLLINMYLANVTG